MSINIPTVSDTSWAIGGSFKHDYGGAEVTHFCVFITGGDCILPQTTSFDHCSIRCFGAGYKSIAKKNQASPRSHVDVYPGMGRWPDDGEIDLWEYPQNCAALNAAEGSSACTVHDHVPSYNPQGFTFTVAGNGGEGFRDGPSQSALFNGPQDVAVDEFGVVYVADTDNHAIRMISLDGEVTTIAGKGAKNPGYADGPCDIATFSFPKGLDVRHEPIEGTNKTKTVLIVADTGNNRIRRIDWMKESSNCTVICLTGLCGNNTLSLSLSTSKATPQTGYADGNGAEARFSAPESVTFMDGIYKDYFVVADTQNFLIRWVVASNGTTYTLAGSIVNGEKDPEGKPLAGCTPPCLVGQQGFRDGNLSYSQFYNPYDVTRGPNNTIYVVDEQRLRVIELPHVMTTLYSVHSMGRVSTIAGTALGGVEDGFGDESTFFYSSGVFVTEDNIAYVVDAASCRIRRVSPLPLVAPQITCSTKATEIIRPSGCTSFDQPLDKIGRKVSRVEANVQYNYGFPFQDDLERGKYIKNCVGSPPRDRLDKHFISQGDNLVIDDGKTEVNEDSEQGTAILVTCPARCSADGGVVQGTLWYSEGSSVCLSAIHSGTIKLAEGGIVQIIIERLDYLNSSSFLSGSSKNGIVSTAIPMNMTHRVFSTHRYNVSNVMVHTVAGNPSAPLESGCGYRDGQPATTAEFYNPSGVAASYSNGLSQSSYLYIADTGNNRIRALSATCTQICENGATCVGPDTCRCLTGWRGIDCTIPTCTSPCGNNFVCVAPDTCACKPGFGGSGCAVPQCRKTCLNGGHCSNPDTCTCSSGWFDPQCSTPVCSQTCANGGNCTAPGTCACPREWTGADCRTPVCAQTCLHGGTCTAPNTCVCPPAWTNYDCSTPVCTQGYFKSYGPSKPTYKNCDIQSWCDATHEFECDQAEMQYAIIELPSGPEYRIINGRKSPPDQCMNIELPTTYKIPFQLLLSDNSNTGNRRYSPNTPYTSNNSHPWRGYTDFTEGHTGPWVYEADRQVANVNWLNVSQGIYVCANEGSCVAPDTCECGPGWIGFDCRTPVCSNGFYFPNQTRYVSGLETTNEIQTFQPFMDNRTRNFRLYWPYSNPAFSIQFEDLTTIGQVIRTIHNFTGTRYRLNYLTEDYNNAYQGGYRCTIRANTQWENRDFIFNHPNFYSQYMNSRRQADNKTYTFWVGFDWPPTHSKSRVLDQHGLNRSFAFTNQGYRRHGIWNRTNNPYEYGVCVLEFYRNCSDPYKQLDLHSNLYEVAVQDTDVSFRPRISYDDEQVHARGRWKAAGGECVDQVLRGCRNNGTCIAPDVCRCAEYWEGADCSVPVCSQSCFHHGNCTGPNICTCEIGWSGFDCSIPLCAQECNNNGVCVAPDTCKCKQWPNTFRDGRSAGGQPLFQDEDGNPLLSGWTGYDCSTPICVQAQDFILNVRSRSSPGFVPMGGHGADTLLTCTDPATGLTLPRCPQFDPDADPALDNIFVTSNDGQSFQTGCGFDPFDTGCCLFPNEQDVACYKCDSGIVHVTNHTFFCSGTPYPPLTGKQTDVDKFKSFLDKFGNFKMCGRYHSPRDYVYGNHQSDYGVPKYYFNVLNPPYSSFNYKSNWTSNRYLCNVVAWEQGDYVDDAGLGKETGVGSIYGLDKGRHIRINTPHIFHDALAGTFTRLAKIRGEGVYRCGNNGSCIAPDVCTCSDGYSGYDCSTPLCRHLQPSSAVTGCLNGGYCVVKDSCNCVQTGSALWAVHPESNRGITGWAGSDCTMPICVQGYYDPYCTDLPQAPGGEGCYRCANNGNCTAPDVCTCAEGWTGYDCRTPVCQIFADPLTRSQLGTSYEDKVVGFENDPCGVVSIYGMHGWKGQKYSRGNCTLPNQCTCLCRSQYNRKACRKTRKQCNGPWQDNMVTVRNVLKGRGAEYSFGSTDCEFGYEGNVDEMDRFTSCHLTIYVPSSNEKSSLAFIIVFSVLGFFAIIAYRYAYERVKRRFLLAKIERRRSKRSSEESILSAGSGAFVNN